jgi:hypothetical protein
VKSSIPKQLVETMAIRARRMHYCLWHEVRGNWLAYPRDLQSELRKAGWEPPRPANNEKGELLLANDSGEDYFYMHRQTIRYANKILGKVGNPDYPRIEGWLEFPAPDDPDFPVPPAWFDPAEFSTINQFIARSKTELTFKKYLKSWEGMFTDPGFLKDISLGSLGSFIQSTVHDTVKRRWSEVPGARRPELGSGVETIPIEWDDPRYNYLADFYSMQVNPVFWKLYGWIDERLENWKVVHGVFGNDFWQGKWVGKLPNAEEGASADLHDRLDDPAVANQHAEEIEQLLLIIGKRLASP